MELWSIVVGYKVCIGIRRRINGPENEWRTNEATKQQTDDLGVSISVGLVEYLWVFGIFLSLPLSLSFCFQSWDF